MGGLCGNGLSASATGGGSNRTMVKDAINCVRYFIPVVPKTRREVAPSICNVGDNYTGFVDKIRLGASRFGGCGRLSQLGKGPTFDRHEDERLYRLTEERIRRLPIVHSLSRNY